MRHTFSFIYCNIFYFVILIFIFIKHQKRNLISNFNLKLLFNSKNIEQALMDAISCVGSKRPKYFFMSKNFNERKNHSNWINNEIKKITPKNVYELCFHGYCGPSIESIWISMEKEDFSIFGPFIPLFVPWIWMIAAHRDKYFIWRDKIISFMEKEYFYITVTYEDNGIEGRNELKNILPDNIIIISGGGKGHIPIPIFLFEYNPNFFRIRTNYKYDLMFAGSLSTHKIRKIMVEQYSYYLGNKFKFYNNSIDWKVEYSNAKFICTPRGMGRGSWRLSETLQSGSVPVYVYNDIIWLPYYDSINWSSFSIVTHISLINETINRIKNTTISEILTMKKRIRDLYPSHFTLNATVHQIKLFLLYGFSISDLRCSSYSSIKG